MHSRGSAGTGGIHPDGPVRTPTLIDIPFARYTQGCGNISIRRGMTLCPELGEGDGEGEGESTPGGVCGGYAVITQKIHRGSNWLPSLLPVSPGGPELEAASRPRVSTKVTRVIPVHI